MYFSIDFYAGDPYSTDETYPPVKRNTYSDWGLVSSSKQIPAQAQPEFKLVSVPGRSGYVNVSQLLTGYPVYKTRTGTFSFIVLNSFNGVNRKWNDIYSEIASFLHGRELKCVMEDDPEFYYVGVFSVENAKPGDYNTTIDIKYEMQAYKKRLQASDDDWLWDPFNFETGVITIGHFKDIQITANETVGQTFGPEPDTENNIPAGYDVFGDEPVVPEFYISEMSGGSGTNPGIQVKATIVVPQIDSQHNYRKKIFTTLIPYNTGLIGTYYQDPSFVIYCPKGGSIKLQYESIGSTVAKISTHFRAGYL